MGYLSVPKAGRYSYSWVSSDMEYIEWFYLPLLPVHLFAEYRVDFRSVYVIIDNKYELYVGKYKRNGLRARRSAKRVMKRIRKITREYQHVMLNAKKTEPVASLDMRLF